MGNRSWLGSPVLVQKYLDAGYAIISIDYRLAPQAKLNQILEDLDEAYRWVRTDGPKLFHIDPNRIAVVGHSAGGYLALMAAFRLAPRPAAVVSFYGYGDIAGDVVQPAGPVLQPAARRDEGRGVPVSWHSCRLPKIQRRRGSDSTSTPVNRASGHEKSSGTIQTRNNGYSIRCAHFATSRRVIRRRYFFMETRTQTSRLNNPCSWPRSWSAMESSTNSLRWLAKGMGSTGTCRIRRSQRPSIVCWLFCKSS